MRFDITYTTTFTYDELVRESQNELRACPASDDAQQLVSYRVTTSPSARVLSFTDYWGTRVDAFGVRTPHLFLEVTAEASVETRPRPLLVSTAPASALRDLTFLDDHIEYLEPSPHATWGPETERLAEQAVDVGGDDVIGQVLAIHRAVGARLAYQPGATYVGVGVEDVVVGGAGVCQDFSHLAIAMCRARGIPARYVSGYMFTVSDATGEDLVGGDVVRVQTHAWFEAAVPNVGWVALDPTNRLQVGERHVKIGHGRDYDDVPPLRGVFAGTAAAEVIATVEIRRSTVGTRPAVPVGAGSRRRRDSGDLPLPGMDDTGRQQQQQQQQQ